MKIEERYKKVADYFTINMPEPQTELNYRTPYELLVAVILSAQCTDKRVNLITPRFFERFPDAVNLASASVEDILELIKSCSYPNNKAKNLSAMARVLQNNYMGNVPKDIDELQKLPGVGRKTANVVASVVFNIPAMAVDTHVYRVAARIGLSQKAKTPFETEKQLVKFFPRNLLSKAHHWLILHGRYICTARKPLCGECGLKGFCKYYQDNIANNNTDN